MAAQKKKSDSDAGSWGLIVFLFAIGVWPIALVLLFTKLFAPDEKRKHTAAPPLREEQAAPAAKKSGRATRAVKKATRQPAVKKGNARAMKILGIIVMVFSLLIGSDYFRWILQGDFYWLWDALASLAWFAGGAGLFAAGQNMTRAMKRYTRYLAVIGKRSAVSIDELVRKLGYSRRRVERDLDKMIDKGYFGDTAYINEELDYLFRTATADEELTRQREEAKRPQTPKEAEEGFSGILRNIRRANDRIADPEVSRQIDRLEEITARIFRAVEDDPAKLGRISTFLNYYLPTTQKLLDSFAEFESAGVEGENLRQAKIRIRDTMENIVAGFEHQLDALYRSDAMDVDKDIRVMEHMLRRDTASVERDFGLGWNSEEKTMPAEPVQAERAVPELTLQTEPVPQTEPAAQTDPLKDLMDAVAATAVPPAAPKCAPKVTDVDLGGMAAQQMEE